ncbi:MAG: 2-hydroxyacid dehydrogenase [Dehalococcoidia bacterium]|jgi:phosphoglycerate dehydrogenase-like enzyme|nr:2-hydroxyacid dehydrogenase [Dehalococcoidia bacterium]
MSNIVVILGQPRPGSEIRNREVQAAADRVGGIDVRRVDSSQSFDAVVEQCQGAVVILPQGPYPKILELAEKLSTLKLVQTSSAGTDWIDKAGLAELGVDVANNGGANAVAVAEHAIGLMFSVNRKLDVQIESVKAGTWMQGVGGDRTEFHTLVGKRIGIVGLGRIGSRVAKRLAGWECEIVYTDIVDHPDDYVTATGARRVELDELLSTSDIVTLHVPLDRVTRHMISDRELGLMKPTAILINTCRGPVVDENALIKGLESKEIFAAGIDVTEIEPVEADNPLPTMTNVVVTPHMATRALESELNGAQFTMENAGRVVRGEAPDWVVAPV